MTQHDGRMIETLNEERTCVVGLLTEATTRRDAPPPDRTLITYSEAIEVPGTAQRVFIHRGHAGDVAALVLIEGLGGLTLYDTYPRDDISVPPALPCPPPCTDARSLHTHRRTRCGQTLH